MVQATLPQRGSSTPTTHRRPPPDETAPMTPPDDRPPGVDQLGWEMAALKKQVEAGFAQVRSDMRDQLSRIEGTVERMAFVDVKLYASEQAAQNDKIESAVKLAMWSLGLVCTLTIASLVALLVRLVSA